MVLDHLITEEESDKSNTHLDIFKDKDQARKLLEGYSLAHWPYEYYYFSRKYLSEYENSPFWWWTSAPSGSLTTPLNGQRNIYVWEFLQYEKYQYQIAIFPKFEQHHEVYFILNLNCTQYINTVHIHFTIDEEYKNVEYICKEGHVEKIEFCRNESCNIRLSIDLKITDPHESYETYEAGKLHDASFFIKNNKTVEGFHAEWHLEFENGTNMKNFETDIKAINDRDV